MSVSCSNDQARICRVFQKVKVKFQEQKSKNVLINMDLNIFNIGIIRGFYQWNIINLGMLYDKETIGNLYACT